jgi:hypothetical protein
MEVAMTVAEDLVAAVDRAFAALQEIGSDQAARRSAPAAWSAKEIIGHLVDSAANNHQRFVRAQQGEALVFPGYDQEHWVASQDYQAADWPELLTLWRLFNHHLAHVIRRIPVSRLDIECRIGDGNAVSLGFLVNDYVVHLTHHLRQIDARLVRS